MDAINGKMTTSTKIKWLVSLVIALVLFLIPESDFYTFQTKMFFVTTVLALAIMAFELLDIMIVSLLLPGLWLLFKVAPASTIFSPWLGTTMFMIIGSFALAEILDSTGLLTRIGYFLMSKVGGSYTKLMFSLFGVGLILSVLTFGAAYVLFAALCLGLCRALNIMGTKMAAAIGMVCMLATCSAKCVIYSPGMYAILLAGAQNVVAGLDVTLDISFIDAYVHNFPMVLTGLVMTFITLKWYKAEPGITNQGQSYFREQFESLGEIKREEKVGFVVLMALIVFLVTTPLHGLDTALGFMVFPFLMLLPGLNVAPASCLKNMKFDMIFFMATCMGIGAVASSLGFSQLFAQIVTPIFTSINNPWILFGFIFLVIFLLNFILTPMAIWAIFTGPILVMALDMGMNPEPIIYALLHSAEAIVFPYEYGSYLSVFAFGMMSMKDFIKLNSVRCVVYVAGFMLLLVPYWMLIGII